MEDIVGSPEEVLADLIGGVEGEVDHVALSRASEVNAGERKGGVYMSVRTY